MSLERKRAIERIMKEGGERERKSERGGGEAEKGRDDEKEREREKGEWQNKSARRVPGAPASRNTISRSFENNLEISGMS